MKKEYEHIEEKIIGILGSGTYLIYVFVAVILLILAILSLFDAITGFQMIIAGAKEPGMMEALHAVLLTIVIIEIMETVTGYLRTHTIQIRPILVAGITAMVRRLLFFDTEPLTALLLGEVVLAIVAILVLTIAIIYLGKEEK
ncbi:phosphate-starvation-inducible PsiE family protein [Methanogenium organophilum]|uniref:Phosphate-starvation-inducible PsiE family protein n=1 Tax=Methanogenium organophilum TaxID=2199 RepID=A0A9X9S2R1_METOG|nr:phosphate-starvation-inducible PsiE family protein [Methanogenium organophilum]WAI00794.1 phosphate-starvation-inducible PsiE family protein [Methanogenium organophilum]